MAHKSLIGGTVYEKYSGADLIDGTVYRKDYGKSLIGGTVYEVGFVPRWRRYTLKLEMGTYTILDSYSKGTWNALYNRKIYSSYAFSPADGYYGTGESVTITNGSNYVGWYAPKEEAIDYENRIKRITVSKVTGDGNLLGPEFEYFTACDAPITFAKGNYIELLSTSAEELPSSGTLLEGGIAEGYCVMYDDDGNDVYYYELS